MPVAGRVRGDGCRGLVLLRVESGGVAPFGNSSSATCRESTSTTPLGA